MLSLAALVTVETQRLLLMRKASEHPQVHELVIANMDLQSMKTSEFQGVNSSLQQEGWGTLVCFEDREAEGWQEKTPQRCGLVLNQTGSQDFVGRSPNPSVLVNPPMSETGNIQAGNWSCTEVINTLNACKML